MFYSLAAQVAGILPSKTPTGTGTLKLTYNGQSATFPITVVENNIGIYTVSTSGTGDAIGFVNSDAQLITPTHAANAGDVIVLWGTGLGPVNLDETLQVGANQADMPKVPLHVYIGGKEAQVNFRGLNGCCTSVDSILRYGAAGRRRLRGIRAHADFEHGQQRHLDLHWGHQPDLHTCES